MDITYLGHSSFKLKSNLATVITDPYDKSVGFNMIKVNADVVTVSHDHPDHNNVENVGPTTRRDKPFIIDAPGEYEVGGVSVFGIKSFHDDNQGNDRGKNVIYSIIMEGLSVVHLGDLGHLLKPFQVNGLNGVDVLMCPVGGHYTIDPKKISELVTQLEPSIFIPMHYKTPNHDPKTFESLLTIDEFLKEFGGESQRTDKLTISKSTLPEDMEIIIIE